MPLEPDDFDEPLRDWCALAQARKVIFGWPDWETAEPWREAPAAARRAGRQPFTSRLTERCRLVILLSDADGASIQGAQVQISTWKHRPLDDMTGLLLADHEGRTVCIARIDCRPGAPHSNKHWRRFQCPPDIEGSHVHPFLQNAMLGREAFGPIGNLPVALPVESEPESFRDFVRLLEDAFGIEGLKELPPPPMQDGLV